MQLVVILCDINSINQLESATLQNITKMKINLADQEFLSQCHLKTSILRIIFNSLCLFQESIASKFLERLAEWCKNIKISDPLEEGCRLGPVVSQGQVHIYAFLILFLFISRRGFSINKFIKTLKTSYLDNYCYPGKCYCFHEVVQIDVRGGSLETY